MPQGGISISRVFNKLEIVPGEGDFSPHRGNNLGGHCEKNSRNRLPAGFRREGEPPIRDHRILQEGTGKKGFSVPGTAFPDRPQAHPAPPPRCDSSGLGQQGLVCRHTDLSVAGFAFAGNASIWRGDLSAFLPSPHFRSLKLVAQLRHPSHGVSKGKLICEVLRAREDVVVSSDLGDRLHPAKDGILSTGS